MTGLKLRIFDRKLEAWQRGKRVRGFPLSRGAGLFVTFSARNL